MEGEEKSVREKYAGLLRQELILILSEDGGLDDYSRVLSLARKRIEQGRDREAEGILKEIAIAVNAAKAAGRLTK